MAVIRVGPDKRFPTIMEAYGVAVNGDTLLIDEGTYTELIFFDQKIVSLIGNTAFPAEGKVIINSSSKSTADIKYVDDAPLIIDYADTNTTISGLIEGIKFETNANGYQNSIVVFWRNSYMQDGVLDLTFNRCILDGTNGVETSLVAKSSSEKGSVTSSLVFSNCEITWREEDLFIGEADCQDIARFVVEKSILSRFPVNTLFNSLDYINIDRKFFVDYYLDVYEYPMPVVGYGPCYGPSLGYNYMEPTHCFSGTTSLNGTSVQRELRFFKSDSDVYVGSTTSDINGVYYKDVFSAGHYDIICLDSDGLPYYDDLIMSKCTPMEVPYTQYGDHYFELINFSAKSGDLTGWAEESGSFTVVSFGSEYFNSYAFQGASVIGTDILAQRVDIVSAGVEASLIDSGELFVYMEHMNYSFLENSCVGIRLLDAAQTIIGTDSYSEFYLSDIDSDNLLPLWTKELFLIPIVFGTRYIDFLLKVTNNPVATPTKFDDIITYIRKPL